MKAFKDVAVTKSNVLDSCLRSRFYLITIYYINVITLVHTERLDFCVCPYIENNNSFAFVYRIAY